MRSVRSKHAWRVVAAGALSSAGVCCSPPATAQSVNIPLQLERANDGVILTINVGINGGPARPYLFDTGSEVFNAYYTSAAAFGGLPPNMASSGLATSTRTLYGDSGPSNEFDANVLAVPSLTFYKTPTSSTGVTLNAVTPSGAASQFIVNAVYAHNGLITDTTPALQSSATFSGYYGIFGADGVAELLPGGKAATSSPSGECTSGGSPCSTVVGGILGQAVVPGTTAGYIVAANGLSLSTLKTNEGTVPGALINGPQSTQCAIASCDPNVILGLTPALLAQFTAGNTRHASLSSTDPAFPNSNVPSLNHFPIDLTVTVSGSGHSLSFSQQTLLDTGTADNQIYQAGLTNGYVTRGTTVTVTTGKPGTTPTIYTTTRTGSDDYDKTLPYTLHIGSDTGPDRTILGVGFFLENSVLFDLTGDAIGYSPNYVTAADIVTSAASPLTIGASSAPLGLAGVISGAGGLAITPGGTATLSGTNTYTGVTSDAGGYLALVGPGSISASRDVSVTASGVFDVSGVTIPGGVAIQSLSGDASANVWLGANTLSLTNANGSFSGMISGNGGLTLSSGVETLGGINVYTGATTVDGGMLVVNGVLAGTSSVQVNAGGILAGSGLIDPPAVTIASGGMLAPGRPGVAGSSLTIVGDLLMQSGSTYVSLVGGNAASAAQISGTASLAGTITASFASAPLSRHYTLLASSGLNGTTFDHFTTINLPQTLSASLAYGTGDVFLNLTSNIAAAPSLRANQHVLASIFDNSFNAGSLPQAFGAVYTLNNGNLSGGLSTLSGESTTGAQHSANLLMSSFLGLMLDPFVEGRTGSDTDAGALGYGPSTRALPPEIAEAFAALKAPPSGATAEQRWSVWGSAYGGALSLGANDATGAHDVSATAYGFASGADYRLTRDTVLGFAVAGAGTGWSTTGLGGGQSSAAQLGIYGKTRAGPVYIAAALAFTHDWASTRRETFSGDLLTGQFEPTSFGARLEAGYRFDVTAAHLPAMTLSPYAAVEPQTFHAPAFSETDLRGGGLGLSYGAVDVVDTRTELGARLATSLPLVTGQTMNLWGRAAWAHDFVGGPVINASFEDLPGSTFLVAGARPAQDTALLSIGSELRMTSALSLIAKFDGRFAGHEQVASGNATLRYAW
jgi:autotransporter-associated beta strand protein